MEGLKGNMLSDFIVSAPYNPPKIIDTKPICTNDPDLVNKDYQLCDWLFQILETISTRVREAWCK